MKRRRENTPFQRLNERLIEAGITKKDIAEKLCLTESCIYNRLWGDTQFTLDDVRIISDMLKLSDSEIVSLFLRKE